MNGAGETLSESSRLASHLRDEILDGVRSPGSRLIERDLAADFGVSRVPVRDALKVLEAEGLVELRPRTWAIVREFTEADLDDLDEVRAVLEPLAFRLAAQRHRRGGLERLQRTLDAELDGARREDRVLARRAAADFHEVVIELSDNRLLADFMQSIRGRLRWSLAQHDDLEHMAHEHAELFEAIRDRRADRAEELARAHLKSGLEQRNAYADAGRVRAEVRD